MSATEPRPNGLTCEVCGKALTGKQRRACGKAHAYKLGSKKVADRKALERQVTEHEIMQQIPAVIAEESRAIVREALTDRVLDSIKDLMDLLPDAVATLRAAMNPLDEDGNPREGYDGEEARKAATLVLRHTMANPSVAPPSAEDQPAPLQVHFNIPQQDVGHPAAGEAGEVTDLGEDGAVELRECMECHKDKPIDEFVSNSLKCAACHLKMQTSVWERYGSLDPIT